MRIKLKEIRNQGYGSNDEIENILKFNKKNYESNLKIKILMVKYEMLYNKSIKLIFLMASIEFNVRVRGKRKKKKKKNSWSQIIFQNTTFTAPCGKKTVYNFKHRS